MQKVEDNVSVWAKDLIFQMLSSGQSDSRELIQSVSRGDMLSRCFKEALRLELTYSDLHSSSPLPQNTLPNELGLKGCSLCCKANKSYQSKVIFSLISEENKAKEIMLVANDLWFNTGVKCSCKAIKEMRV